MAGTMMALTPASFSVQLRTHGAPGPVVSPQQSPVPVCLLASLVLCPPLVCVATKDAWHPPRGGAGAAPVSESGQTRSANTHGHAASILQKGDTYGREKEWLDPHGPVPGHAPDTQGPSFTNH